MSRKSLAPNSDLDGMEQSHRSLTTEQVLEKVYSSRKRAYKESNMSQDQDSESDYFDDSEADTLGGPPDSESIDGPTQIRRQSMPKRQAVTPAATSRKASESSGPLNTRKQTKGSMQYNHSHSAPPRARQLSSTPPFQPGSSCNEITPLSRTLGSKLANRQQPLRQANPVSPSDDDGVVDDIAATLKEISNTLNKVVRKIDKQETRLDSMEKKIASSCRSSVSSSSGESAPKKIPPIIRSEVRRIYRALCDGGENFVGFDLDAGVTFKDQKNNEITDKLIREVKAANPGFQSGMIKGAVYTYYRSLSQEASLQRRGKKNERDRERRQRERLNRKLKSRLSVLEKSRLSDEDKRSWRMVIIPELMSSESSCTDSDDDTLIKRQLPWRSEKVTEFFLKLDSHSKETKSTQAKRQMKARLLSDDVSTRDIPGNIRLPSWAIKDN